MDPPEPQAATREQHMEQHPLLQTDLEARQRFRGLFHTAGGTQTRTRTVQSLHILTPTYARRRCVAARCGQGTSAHA